MRQRTEEEVFEFVSSLWKKNADGLNRLPDEIQVSVNPDKVEITLSSMYDAPGLSFNQLFSLSEFFDTKNINDDEHFHSPGCESCDYGSVYGFTLTVRPEVQPKPLPAVPF